MSLWLGILGMLVGCLIFFLFIPIKSTPESVHAPLQRSAIASPRPWYFWASFAAVVVVSLLVYRFLGAQDELVLRDKMAELVEVSKNQPELAESKARELIDHLESATQKYPDKPDYWFLLANQSFSLKEYQAAADAYAVAYRLAPDEINLLAKQAEAQYLASEYALTEQVQQLLNKVVDEEPQNPIAMSILAITAYRNQQFDMAILFWERGLSELPPNSADARTMRATIARVKSQLDIQAPSEVVVRGESFAVNVSLAEGLSFPSDTPVFVFVRQAGGPRAPIVVERTRVGALPASYVMNDAKVMIQGQSLKNFPSLEVVARVSLTGQPAAQSGDYQGVVGPVSLADIDAAVDLVIADAVP